ncbi:telomere repeat-binding protein 2-like isoform X2 [Magnolia sinica]|uniref:telomere repeat-binding protein 2-like isoform X2 n=1 Tax=Magnolia sinica TaxID=86752 RepID=UPI00265ACD7E|nr:telomere repeat-binding protein 2-like isoform X2 [Magnolia sinica]
MVLQKRLDYGFNGYQVPAMPRASRSARGKRSFGKKVEDNRMCAFDLLATVAGNLLLEKESSPVACHVTSQFAGGEDNIKQEQHNEGKPFKQGPCDHPCNQGSCDESGFYPKVTLRRHSENYALKEHSHVQDDLTLGPTSMITKSERSEKLSCAEESPIGNSSNGFENFPGTVHGKCHAERGSLNCAESHDHKVGDEIERNLEAEHQRIGNVKNGIVLDVCSTEDPMEMDTKPPALVSSDSSIEVPLCGNHILSGSLPRHQDNLKVVNRDDDENSSGCTQPSPISLKAFRPPRLGDRRIRKLLASKYWKVAPTLFKDEELSNSDSETNTVFRSRKICYTRQRTQRCSPFKKRKLVEQSSVSTSDGGISSEGVSNSPAKAIKGEANGSTASLHGASGASSPVPAQKPSFGPEDSHALSFLCTVKLSIKSFRVPELFIEIPETATVGSLKRTVMEAVTAILGGGLRVGVLLQGKKVRDDSKTLLQTGISHDDKLDGLGFTLEPNTSHAPPPLCCEDPHLLLPCDATQPLTRSPAVPALDQGVPDVPSKPQLTNLGNCIESDHDSVPSPADMSLEKTMPDSRALVAIPSMSVEALAVVPLHRKSRRSELVQRRIRRPFSVTEVEALVQAVEKLGTGRWRDVKLRAFENAKHRTYVDLKDKWKTLVHTARISPQQRRGEPVPQELLDRVLSAHAYWAQHQAKQQLKQQQLQQQADSSCLL